MPIPAGSTGEGAAASNPNAATAAEPYSRRTGLYCLNSPALVDINTVDFVGTYGNFSQSFNHKITLQHNISLKGKKVQERSFKMLLVQLGRSRGGEVLLGRQELMSNGRCPLLFLLIPTHPPVSVVAPGHTEQLPSACCPDEVHGAQKDCRSGC